jgi:hypothetical protein
MAHRLMLISLHCLPQGKPDKRRSKLAAARWGAEMSGAEQMGTRPKKVRGKSKASIELTAAIRDIAEAVQPITVRGIGYRLFSKGSSAR